MSNAFIRVRAKIQLLADELGARTPPIQGSYRPNHNFGAADNKEMTVGFIEFADGEVLRPGEAVETEIVFWPRPGLKEDLTPGRNWRIQEGSRLVGVGTVVEVLGE